MYGGQEAKGDVTMVREDGKGSSMQCVQTELVG